MGRFTDDQPLPNMPRNHVGLTVAPETDAVIQQQQWRNDAVRDRVGLFGDKDVVDRDEYGETEDGYRKQIGGDGDY